MNKKIKTKLYSLTLKALRLSTRFHDWIQWYFSDERKNPYRCEACGSTDIQVKAWINPNYGNAYVSDTEDDEGWCEKCQEHYRMVSTDRFLQWADEWWKNAEMTEKVATIRQLDPDGKQFDETASLCDQWWEKQSMESKISTYITHRNHA